MNCALHNFAKFKGTKNARTSGRAFCFGWLDSHKMCGLAGSPGLVQSLGMPKAKKYFSRASQENVLTY
jgi:hypothetical protein